MKTMLTPLALLLLLALAACGDRGKDHAHKDHDHKDHAHNGDDHGGHHHDSPRGGTLVELGDHYAQLDFVLDKELGTFAMYVMDAHAEHPVRIEQKSVEIMLPVPKKDAKGEPGFTLTLHAVANENTGDKVGDTSKFEAPLADLKGFTDFDGKLVSITVKGRTFTDVVFKFTAPKPK